MFDRIGCNSEEYTRELGGGTLVIIYYLLYLIKYN